MLRQVFAKPQLKLHLDLILQRRNNCHNGPEEQARLYKELMRSHVLRHRNEGEVRYIVSSVAVEIFCSLLVCDAEAGEELEGAAEVDGDV